MQVWINVSDWNLFVSGAPIFGLADKGIEFEGMKKINCAFNEFEVLEMGYVRVTKKY
jgi:hypothetical protein